jgi:hypothetical protein
MKEIIYVILKKRNEMSIAVRSTEKSEFDFKPRNNDEQEKMICEFIKKKEKEGIKAVFKYWNMPIQAFQRHNIEPPVWYKKPHKDI